MLPRDVYVSIMKTGLMLDDGFPRKDRINELTAASGNRFLDEDFVMSDLL